MTITSVCNERKDIKLEPKRKAQEMVSVIKIEPEFKPAENTTKKKKISKTDDKISSESASPEMRGC